MSFIRANFDDENFDAPKRVEPTRDAPFSVFGNVGSPYTLKMRAYFRYRRLPVDFVPFSAALREKIVTKAPVIPKILWPDGKTLLADSTPMILRIERETAHLGRKVTFSEPAINFLAHLIEDFADEWVTKIMFAARWYHPRDQIFGRKLVGLGINFPGSAKDADGPATAFANRQVGRNPLVFGPNSNIHIINQTFDSLMTILESHLAAGHLFLLGGTQRPSIADFAMYGQLFQFCVMDTTYSLRVREEYAGRAFLYCMRIDDLSGTGFDTSIGLKTAEPEPKITQLPPTTLQLLRLIGQVYLPFLLANERACNTQGATKESYKVTFGEDWPAYIGQPFTYQRKCLLWLREHLGYALERAGYEERTALEGVLKESGCWEGLVNGEGGVLGTKLKGKI